MLFILAYHVCAVTGAINDGAVGDTVIVLGNQALLLFFAISGFLLYRPYVSARAKGRSVPNTARYARRRVLRIVPAYWVALTVLAIFPGIVGVFTGDWWRYYFFNQLYSHDTIGGGIPPAWSLSVEVTFYLSLPLWAMLLRRISLGSTPWGWLRGELVALGVVAAVGIAFQVAAARQLISDLVAQSLAGQVTWLAVGMCLAVLSVAVERNGSEPRAVRAVVRHSALCWLGALAALAGLVVILHPGGLFGLIIQLRTQQPYMTTLASIALTALFLTLVVAPAVFGEHAGGLPRRVMAWAPVAWIGMLSYGIYLWHLPVAHVLGRGADPGHFSATGVGLAGKIHTATTPILFVLTLAATCVVAAISYYVIELPFLKRKEG